MNNPSIAFNITGWVFGFIGCAIGIVNMFWGNDPYFGVFIFLASLIFFPPVTGLIRQVTGIRIPGILKILLGVFIVWAALGVGELFDKIELMLQDLR